MSLSQSMPRMPIREDSSEIDRKSGPQIGDHDEETRRMKRRHSSPFRPYNGDIFGTQGDYLPGMLYLSRMKVHKNPIDAIKRFQQAKEEYQANLEAKAAAKETAAELESLDSESSTIADPGEKMNQDAPQSFPA